MLSDPQQWENRRSWRTLQCHSGIKADFCSAALLRQASVVCVLKLKWFINVIPVCPQPQRCSHTHPHQLINSLNPAGFTLSLFSFFVSVLLSSDNWMCIITQFSWILGQSQKSIVKYFVHLLLNYRLRLSYYLVCYIFNILIYGFIFLIRKINFRSSHVLCRG